jgi:hypothetical protein
MSVNAAAPRLASVQFTAAHLTRPLQWIQSGGPHTTEYTQGRDRLLGRLRDGGALATIPGSTHTGFTDAPSYLTAVGRSAIDPQPASARTRSQTSPQSPATRSPPSSDPPSASTIGRECPFTRLFARTD